RDLIVTGVQTCALPIYIRVGVVLEEEVQRIHDDPERWLPLRDVVRQGRKEVDALPGAFSRRLRPEVLDTDALLPVPGNLELAGEDVFVVEVPDVHDLDVRLPPEVLHR